MKLSVFASACFALSVDKDVYLSNTDGFAVSANPLVACKGFKGQFVIESIDLNPYPIVSGGNLQVSAAGNLKERVVKGSKVVIAVKFGKVTIFSKTVDLCEEAAKNDISCPLEVGRTLLKAGQLVPSQAPAGAYDLEFRVKNANGNDLACIAGKVDIIKKGKN